MVTHSQVGTVKPTQRLSLYTSYVSPVPKSPFVAFKDPHWWDAMSDEYNARMVANGSSQQIGIDCDETFYPVFKLDTIQTVLSLALSRHWPIHQLDVKNAFLNEISIWFDTCTSCMVLAFCKICYYDNIVLTASSTSLLQRIISSLHREFEMADLGGLQYLTFTRPDLSYVILRYVRGTLDFGLQLYTSSTASLVAYS
ncbi:ribonuclease H-like domain-containing protein [Tanacetum coccineum]